MDIPTLHGLCEAMHAAFRQAGPLGQLAHTLCAMVTQHCKLWLFGPKSHVGRLSEG